MEHMFFRQRFRNDIMGAEEQVPIMKNKKTTFINFDNAASTPALRPVWHMMEKFLCYYSGVHRGTGYKSMVSSNLYDDVHTIIGNFVKADMDKNVVILVKNTTEAINKLSARLNLKASDVVLTTDMEHNSNDLPWRRFSKIDWVKVDCNGRLDLFDLEMKLKKYYPNVKLLTVTGASNVTGYINDIHHIAALAHGYGSRILVDAAQLAAHRSIDMKPNHDSNHIDFLAFSGHKMYAPFGCGVLIGPRECFANSPPDHVGGGTIKVISYRKISWAELPDKEEAGSPNVLGAFALAEAIKYLEKFGLERIAQYEHDLCNYAYQKIKKIPGIMVYGNMPRLGVISLNLDGFTHSKLGAILGAEGGIGVRTGCFCAQNYVRTLLGISDPVDLSTYEKPNALLPGMVRISLAPYNMPEEVDRFCNLLSRITSNRDYYQQAYIYSPQQEQYVLK